MAFEVEEIDLTPFHPSPGRVSLGFTPARPTEVAVDPIGGPAQVYGEDFLVVGNQLIWKDAAIASSDINGVLENYPVKVRVMYER